MARAVRRAREAMPRKRVFAVAFVMSCVLGGCAPTSSNVGMVSHAPRPDPTDGARDELARAVPPEGHRALLVVFPKSACSGTARTVFFDEGRRFFGAVGPGEAALLVVPTAREHLFVASSVEVMAPAGTRFVLGEIDLVPPPSGVLLESLRLDARQCGNGHDAAASVATKRELEATLAEGEFRWVEARSNEGDTWLAEHRARVDQMLGGRVPVTRASFRGR